MWNDILMAAAAERGEGRQLGKYVQTRQLNAPWAWWISNWRLITSEVCWIRLSVMNWRDRAWQISAVPPLPELWRKCVWVCASSAGLLRECVCVYRMMLLWHVESNRKEMKPTGGCRRKQEAIRGNSGNVWNRNMLQDLSDPSAGWKLQLHFRIPGIFSDSLLSRVRNHGNSY